METPVCKETSCNESQKKISTETHGHAATDITPTSTSDAVNASNNISQHTATKEADNTKSMNEHVVQGSSLQDNEQTPRIQNSTMQEPTTQASALQEPAPQEPRSQERVLQESTAQESVMQDSFSEHPPLQETTTQESYSQSTAVQERVLHSKFFGVLSLFGPLLVVLFCIPLFIPWIHTRTLTGNTALHWENLFIQMRATGFGIPIIDGIPAVDYSPAYIVLLQWLQAGFTAFGIALSDSLTLFVGSAFFATILAIVIWFFALITTKNRQIALAASCVLVASIPFVLAGNSISVNMIGTCCLICAASYFYLGWIRERAFFLLSMGFFFTALSVIFGNPIAALGLLLSNVFFLIWRGTFRRAGAADGALGFGLLLVCLLGWFTWLGSLAEGQGFFIAFVHTYVTDAWAIPNIQTLISTQETVLFLVFLTIPWCLLVLFLPWEETPKAIKRAWTNRHEAPGIGWLWCLLLAGSVLAVFSWPQENGAFFLVLAPAVILAAKSLFGLSALRSTIFFRLLSLFFICIGLFLGFIVLWPFLASWLPETLNPIGFLPPLLTPLNTPTTAPLLTVVAPLCLVTALLLWFVARTGYATHGLLLMVFFVLLVVQPYHLWLVPHTTNPINTIKSFFETTNELNDNSRHDEFNQ